MKTGLHFLVAAKRCEIDELHQLALTSELVKVTGRLVHALQRERGLSNLVLGSQGARFKEERAAQMAECGCIETALRACFHQLEPGSASSGHSARLFSRMAYALQGLDALPALRAQVDTLAWSPARATQAFVQVVAALLAVVFEAADSATDPGISRRLVALFQFMQGKEFAGQERAVGSALWASGRASAADQQRLLHLIESQEHCLEVFTSFANDAARELWLASERDAQLAGLEKMRRVLCTAADGAPLDAELSPLWFDRCSDRMDRMKAVEDRLADDLAQACSAQMATARAELAAFEALVNAPAPAQDALGFFAEN